MIEKEILSPDTVEDLRREFNRVKSLRAGLDILDVGEVWGKLTDWILIEDAEKIIPYKYSKPRTDNGKKFDKRVWWLSHTKDSKTKQYYAGCWFDIKAKTADRVHRTRCKLSESAIIFFKEYYNG